ncbi:hypothetical protein BDW67DRAFT_152645 [Aspergillus spinulosporus]
MLLSIHCEQSSPDAVRRAAVLLVQGASARLLCFFVYLLFRSIRSAVLCVVPRLQCIQ